MVTYQQILTEEDDGVAIVTFNRPDRMNAWTWRMGLELAHAVATYDARDDIRAIVVTGAGRAFCAGADLGSGSNTFQGDRRRGLGDDADALRAAVTKEPYEMNTPVIVAINGHAVGVGLTITMHYDIRVAAEDAKLSFAFNRRGVVPEVGSQWLVPRLVGVSRGLELLLTGKIIRGREAADIGLVSAAYPAGEVLERALDIARDIKVNVAPVSAAIVKRNVYLGLEEPDRKAAHRRESALFGWTTRHDDAREGPLAFVEKREPKWTLSKNADFPEELFA